MQLTFSLPTFFSITLLIFLSPVASIRLPLDSFSSRALVPPSLSRAGNASTAHPPSESSRRRALSPLSERLASSRRTSSNPFEHRSKRRPEEQLLRQKRASESRPIPDTWFIQKAYQGQSFFNDWSFATYPDPTHGQVTYVSREWAESTNMSYVNAKGQAVMRVDNWSTLTQGQARNSVRIESLDVFNKGLFILDVEQAPWGCGVWPAWWTVGSNWPFNGEIDIIEGVHDNIHNQVALHTDNGCQVATPSASTPLLNNYTGITLGTNCYAYENSNSGCAILDNSQASYGPQFNVLQGGVFAMMWLDDAIRVWFFHRAAVPSDVTNNAPKPSNWGPPMAFAGTSASCNIGQYFREHQIIFDITFCGDWAGSSYIDSGCPGTCSDRIQQPSNFANASWTINYLHVFGSPDVSTSVNAGTGSASTQVVQSLTLMSTLTIFVVLLQVAGIVFH